MKTKKITFFCKKIIQKILGPLADYYPGRDRQGASIRMAEEYIKSYEGSGYALSKKLAHHKVAEAQRQYSHMYWSGKLVK